VVPVLEWGVVDGESEWIVNNEPLAGPGPPLPAATGTPVSAMVGVTAGSALASEADSGVGIAVVADDDNCC